MSNIYTVEVPNQINTVSGAIASIIASGLTEYDTGYVYITQSGYYNEITAASLLSGSLYIEPYPHVKDVSINQLNFLNSGNINISNISTVINTSGNGLLELNTISGSFETNNDLIVYNSIIENCNCVNNDSVRFNNCNLNGSGKLYFNNVQYSLTLDECSFDDYTNTGYKLNFINCSSLLLETNRASNISGNLMLLSGCPDFNITHNTLVSNVSGYAVLSLASGVVNSSGNIHYSILVGDNGTGDGPINLSNTNQSIVSTGLSCIYDFIGSSNYNNISGVFFNRDPLLVNPISGDLRPAINSPCASTADNINAIITLGDAVVEPTPINYNNAKFYLPNTDQLVKAIPPSSIYTVGDGLALFFKADENLDNDIDVIVNKQYKIHNNSQTFQSYINNGLKGFESDYKLIPYIDYSTNRESYYVQPFTILSFEDLLNAADLTYQDISISGIFRFTGFSRDSFIDKNENQLYWVGEYYNNYLYGYSNITNERVYAYPLFVPSGTPPSVVLSDLNYIQQNAGITTVLSKNVFVKDHYEERYIQINNPEGSFKFKSFENDNEIKIAALGTLSDWLFILQRQQKDSDNDGIIDTKHNLYLFNKYEKEPFIQPIKVFSGLVDKEIASDITFNNKGQCLISTSGFIHTFDLYYDYALASYTPESTIKTTLLLREKYDEVKL